MDVTARGPHLAAIHRRARPRRRVGRPRRAVRRRSLDPAVPRDAVLLAVKSTGAPRRCGRTRRRSGTPLLVVQNGLDAIDTAEREAAGAAAVLGGLRPGHLHLEPGRVTVTGPGALFVGAGRKRRRASCGASPTGSPRPSAPRSSTTSRGRWSKLVINQVNAARDHRASVQGRRRPAAAPHPHRIHARAVRVAIASGCASASCRGSRTRCCALARAPRGSARRSPHHGPPDGRGAQRVDAAVGRRGQPAEVDAERRGRPRGRRSGGRRRSTGS